MVVNIVLGLLALFVILSTALPLLRKDMWWIRIGDFPRIQLALTGLLVAGAYGFWWDALWSINFVLLGLLIPCVIFQAIRVAPYTPLAPRQVRDAEDRDPDRRIRLLISNVLMPNREAEGLLDAIQQYDPDLVLTVECDDWWEERLRVLEDDYPQTLKHPLDNTYGMLLYSRLDLIDPEIKFLVEDDIPSMHMQVRLPGGDCVWLHCIHPDPPNPKYADSTTERDAELLIVGKALQDFDEPVIVSGDLNDVAWSYTTDLFQRVSELLDPRRGRGMYNSFNAKNPLMRWPLDHVFHSEHFTLGRLERGPAYGSDHFPMFIELYLEPGAEAKQETPKADADDEKMAQDKLSEANQKEAV